MITRCWIGLCVLVGVVCLATTTGFGQEKTTLEWTAFKKEGKPFYQELRTETVQEMTVQDMKFKQTQDQTFWFEWTPKGEEDDEITIEQKILGVKMDLDIGGNKIKFNSKDKNPPKNPMTAFFKALEGEKFTLTVDAKTLKVKEVEGLDELVDKLAKVNKSMEPLLKQILSENAVKQMAEPVLGVLPENGEIPDDKTWKVEDQELNMGPIGKYITNTTYTYKGQKKDSDNLAEIDVKTDLEYEPPSESKAKEGGLPFRIVKGDLKSVKANGQIFFDTEKGRIDSSKMHVELKGSLTVNISDMETTVELDQTQDVTLTTLAKNPMEETESE